MKKHYVIFRKRIKKINPLAVFYYLCLTALIVRGAIFLAINYNRIPAVYVRGVHMHHFVFGFLILLIAFLKTSQKNLPNWILEMLYGIALGLIFDEFIFWTQGEFDYWSMGNFYALAALSISAGMLSLAHPMVYQIRMHKNKPVRVMKYSFKRHVFLPWASFVGVMFVIFVLISQ
jgi:hypothetical protein